MGAGLSLFAQNEAVFKKIPLDSLGITIYHVFPMMEGSTLITSSVGIWNMKGRDMQGPDIIDDVIYDAKGRLVHKKYKIRSFTAEDSIRSVAQGRDSIIYFVAHDNRFWFRLNGISGGFGWAPFNFPKTSNVTRIWIDSDNTLYAGTRSDNFFIIKEAATKKSLWGMEVDGDKDSNCIVTKGALPIEQIIISPGTAVYSFAQDAKDKNLIWVGAGNGLYNYNKVTGKCSQAIQGDTNKYTVTEINTKEKDKVWFSTLERGMGAYNVIGRSLQFFPYLKTNKGDSTRFPIKTFCYKSPHQFFVAVMDSFPAIFNTNSGNYMFFADSIIRRSESETTDIKVDYLGKLLLVRNGVLYVSDVSKSGVLSTAIIPDSSLLAPFIMSISLFSGEELSSMWNNPELLKRIELKHDQHSFIVHFGVNDFAERRDVVFAYKVEGYTNGWIETIRSNIDEMNLFSVQDLRPGKYTLYLKVKIGQENWRSQMAKLEIIVLPPFWQTWWFWILGLSVLGLLAYFLVQWKVNSVRKFEREKVKHERELLELEARSLRAQMNPHFIYNCLNSIKALIQSDNKQMATDYLTTFSKLIRTLFQNSDKRQISLYDELETCRLYTKLEAMRLNDKLKYSFDIDPNLDLKSLMVPALIVQPFIENAIWHGIVPKENAGEVNVSVKGNHESIVCTVDDDGIGRKLSKLNAPDLTLNHESRGVHLSQARLDIEKILNDKSATIQTTDKYIEEKPSGTRVIITFNLQ